MPRILVAYATKHHSTEEIAEAIAEELRDRGDDVECMAAGDAPSPERFDAVVLGSAVYAGRWRREARHYLKSHHDELAELSFWIFSSGPVGDMAEVDFSENEKWLEPHKVLELAESAGMRGHIVFGGKVPSDPGNFVERSMAKNTPEEFKDIRDWDQIRAWADEIADQLVPDSRQTKNALG